MYAAPFEYVRPSSFSDAVVRLVEGGEDAHVIAGGQSLVPMMLLGLARPAVLVDIGRAGKRSIERQDGALAISALTRHVELETSELVREACPMLSEAAALIGNVRVRHRGTIGGSLAHAEPTAELPCVAVALGATVHALGPNGERAIPAAELFVTHLTTSLEPGEIITRIDVPPLRPNQGSCFCELSRRPGDFAMVEAVAVITVGDDGRCTDVRLVVGATSDRPADHSASADGMLRGEDPDERQVEDTARAIAEEVEIGPSTHAGEEYRRAMVAVLAQRALLTAATRARAEKQSAGGAPR